MDDRLAAQLCAPVTDRHARDAYLFQLLMSPFLRTIESKGGRMPGIEKKDLYDIFTYHEPQPGDPPRYIAIREAALNFAAVILKQTPSCPDQTVAIRKVREAVMTANAAIATGGKF